LVVALIYAASGELGLITEAKNAAAASATETGFFSLRGTHGFQSRIKRKTCLKGGFQNDAYRSVDD
jgi:hypothetical protein